MDIQRELRVERALPPERLEWQARDRLGTAEAGGHHVDGRRHVSRQGKQSLARLHGGEDLAHLVCTEISGAHPHEILTALAIVEADELNGRIEVHHCLHERRARGGRLVRIRPRCQRLECSRGEEVLRALLQLPGIGREREAGRHHRLRPRERLSPLLGRQSCDIGSTARAVASVASELPRHLDVVVRERNDVRCDGEPAGAFLADSRILGESLERRGRQNRIVTQCAQQRVRPLLLEPRELGDLHRLHAPALRLERRMLRQCQVVQVAVKQHAGPVELLDEPPRLGPHLRRRVDPVERALNGDARHLGRGHQRIDVEPLHELREARGHHRALCTQECLRACGRALSQRLVQIRLPLAQFSEAQRRDFAQRSKLAGVHVVVSPSSDIQSIEQYAPGDTRCPVCLE